MYFNFARFDVVEGKMQDAHKALCELSAASYLDTGCYAYQVATAMGGENALYTLEVWDSLEHLDAHMKTPHIAVFNEKAQQLLSCPPNVTTLEM